MLTGDGVMLSNPQFTESDDNEEWVTIRRALKETILETIEQRGLVIDFNETTKNLLNSMKHELEKPRTNVPVLFRDPVFQITNLSLKTNKLVVNGALGAKASIIPGASDEYFAVKETNSDMPLNPAAEKLRLRMDRLILQIDNLEKQLGHFREVLNN